MQSPSDTYPVSTEAVRQIPLARASAPPMTWPES
jgi:hypothetical protein